MSRELNRLIGLTVMSFAINDVRNEIYLHGFRGDNLSEETWRLDVFGDCCSTSWVEDIFESSSLVGHTIEKIEDLALSGAFNGDADSSFAGPESDSECRSFYGLAIFTEVGRCVLDYRNDSNGYYGGWVELNRVEK